LQVGIKPQRPHVHHGRAIRLAQELASILKTDVLQTHDNTYHNKNVSASVSLVRSCSAVVDVVDCSMSREEGVSAQQQQVQAVLLAV
jgi:hypothetical protein